MSKTKKIKQKTTGFDIVFRVVTAISAIAMFPLFYFGKLLTFEITHTSISELLNNFKEEADKTLEVTYDSIRLSTVGDLIDTVKGFMKEGETIEIDLWGNELYRPVLIAAILIGIALVLALVIFFVAVFSNKAKLVAILSGAGLLFTFGAYGSFTWFLADKLLSGEVSLAQLFNIDGVIISTIIGYLGEVTIFRLDGAFYSVLFLMLFILIWSLSVVFVNSSDEKEKAMKEAAKKHK